MQKGIELLPMEKLGVVRNVMHLKGWVNAIEVVAKKMVVISDSSIARVSARNFLWLPSASW